MLKEQVQNECEQCGKPTIAIKHFGDGLKGLWWHCTDEACKHISRTRKYYVKEVKVG